MNGRAQQPTPKASQWGSNRDYPSHPPVQETEIITRGGPLSEGMCPLRVVQQPKNAKVAADRKEKGKIPLDPPLIVEIIPARDVTSTLNNPFLFMSVEILGSRPRKGPQEDIIDQGKLLSGQLVSSLHRINYENKDHGMFVFGDINLKITGKFRIKCNLWEIRQCVEDLKGKNGETASAFQAFPLESVVTDEFTAWSTKEFPGQQESSALSKALCDSGIKLRIRKETSKRKSSTQEWSQDYYTQMPAAYRGGSSSYDTSRSFDEPRYDKRQRLLEHNPVTPHYQGSEKSYRTSLERGMGQRSSESSNYTSSSYTSLPPPRPIISTYSEPHRQAHTDVAHHSANGSEHQSLQTWAQRSSSNSSSDLTGRQDAVPYRQHTEIFAQRSSSSTRMPIGQVLSNSRGDDSYDHYASNNSYAHTPLEPSRPAGAILPHPGTVGSGRAGATGDLNSYASSSRNSYHDIHTAGPSSAQHDQGFTTARFNRPPRIYSSSISAEEAEQAKRAEEHSRRPM